MVNKHASSLHVFTFVLTVAVGLVAVVIAYATFKGGSFELRSKAAAEEVVLEKWTFNTEEDNYWEAINFFSSKKEDGLYKLQIFNSVNEPSLKNQFIQTRLSHITNKLRIQMTVDWSQQDPYKADVFKIAFYEKYVGNTTFSYAKEFIVIADGKEHEYTTSFSDSTGLKTVSEAMLVFPKTLSSEKIDISIKEIAIVAYLDNVTIGLPTQKVFQSVTQPGIVSKLSGAIYKFQESNTNAEPLILSGDFDWNKYVGKRVIITGSRNGTQKVSDKSKMNVVLVTKIELAPTSTKSK